MLGEYTIEELQVEYFMHLIEEDPQAAYPRTASGDIQFRTGDPVIDKWEEQLAKNEDAKIDWDAGVDPVFLEKFKRHSKKVAQRFLPQDVSKRETISPQQPPPEIDLSDLGGFDDDYSKEPHGG